MTPKVVFCTLERVNCLHCFTGKCIETIYFLESDKTESDYSKPEVVDPLSYFKEKNKKIFLVGICAGYVIFLHLYCLVQ